MCLLLVTTYAAPRAQAAFLDLTSQLGGEKLLPRRPRTTAESGGSGAGGEEEGEGGADEGAEGPQQNFRSDRRLIRLVRVN